MARPKKKESEKSVNIHITLSNYVYKNLKKKKVKISSYIDQLLRVSLSTGTDPNKHFAQSNSSYGSSLPGGIPLFNPFLVAKNRKFYN